jgi:hypothetical protein
MQMRTKTMKGSISDRTYVALEVDVPGLEGTGGSVRLQMPDFMYSMMQEQGLDPVELLESIAWRCNSFVGDKR